MTKCRKEVRRHHRLPPFRGDFGSFKRAIISQESGGRYGVANAEGSGAMGLGQVMPDTARALSSRIGIPYQPDLLSGNSPRARSYQDKITDAALQEAWQAGGGNAESAARYYFAGPNKAGHGRKTDQYGRDILRRMGRT